MEKGQEIPRVSYFDDRWYRIQKDDGKVEYYPSVTTKLGIVAKYGLDRWRGDIGNREADLRMHDAQWKGKRIHHAWEIYLQGKTIGFWQADLEEKPDYDFCFTAQEEYIDFLKLVQFLNVVNPEIAESEFTVVSHDNKEAGTLDNLFYIKEGEYLINGRNPVKLEQGLYVADLKTGSEVYDESYMQVAAYMKMYEESKRVLKQDPTTGEKDFIETPIIRGALILHTNAKIKNGIYGFATKLRTREELEKDYIDFRHAASLWERKNEDVKPVNFDFPKYVKREVEDVGLHARAI